jgi:hypothetical protein
MLHFYSTGEWIARQSSSARNVAARVHANRATLRIQIGETVGSLIIPINASPDFTPVFVIFETRNLTAGIVQQSWA